MILRHRAVPADDTAQGRLAAHADQFGQLLISDCIQLVVAGRNQFRAHRAAEEDTHDHPARRCTVRGILRS